MLERGGCVVSGSRAWNWAYGFGWGGSGERSAHSMCHGTQFAREHWQRRWEVVMNHGLFLVSCDLAVDTYVVAREVSFTGSVTARWNWWTSAKTKTTGREKKQKILARTARRSSSAAAMRRLDGGGWAPRVPQSHHSNSLCLWLGTYST
jgi:hypothetical protein